MKKLLSLVVSICAIVVCLCLLDTPVQAEEIIATGTCGEAVTWSLDSEGTLTITGNGNMDQYRPFDSYRSLIRTVVVQNGVTSIEGSAFAGCSSLISITIPGSVTNIGSSAFESCSSLTSITIPEGVTNIEECAFSDCSSLTSITIPDSVTSIGWNAFSDCRSLISITIPGSVTNIGSSAFESCSSLISITIPGSVTNIGSSAFESCSSLTSITIPSGVTQIGSNAFANCSDLTYVMFEGDKPNLDGNAFTGCNPLVIGYYAGSKGLHPDDWYGWYDSLPEGSYFVPRIPQDLSEWVVDSGYCGSNVTWSLDREGTLTISGTGSMSFDSREATSWASWHNFITSVIVEDGVTTICEYAFEGCVRLVDVSIGRNVESIGNCAFAYCSSLESIVIPASVRSLGDGVFANCDKLTLCFTGNSPTVEGNLFGDEHLEREGMIQYYEGAVGFDSDPWWSYVPSPQHVGQWVVDVAPNCSEEGSAHIDCTYCQSTFTKTIPAQHSFQSHVCSVCGNVRVIDSGRYSYNEYASDVLWKLDITGALTIYGDGYMGGYDIIEQRPWNKYGQMITSVTIEEGVTSIGARSLSYCTNLTTVVIADGVESIEEEAFYGCVNLQSITIPASLESIGKYAFYGCDNLVSVHIGSIEAWSQIIFGNYHLDSNSERLNANPFHNLIADGYLNGEKVTALSLPVGITRVNDFAFYSWNSLTSVVIPEGVTSIGYGAFCDCSSLTSITIPEGVTSIGYGAFYNCSSLTSITIPDGVSSIGGYAFFGCSGLTTITFMGSAPSFDEYDFRYVNATAYYPCNDDTWTDSVLQDYGGSLTWIRSHSWGPETCTLCGCGPDITWTLDDKGTLTISGTGPMENYASALDAPWYSQYDRILAVVVQDGVTSIGDYAFCGCIALTDVSIGKDVKTIGSRAFAWCWCLEYMEIPGNVIELKDGAFLNTGLKVVTFEGHAPTIDYEVFTTSMTGYGTYITVQYYHGATGFSGDLWNQYTLSAQHIGQWIVDALPTCEADGSAHIDCIWCQATFTKTLPARHSYKFGVCSICGDVKIVDQCFCDRYVCWTMGANQTLTIHKDVNEYPCSYGYSEYGWFITSVEIKSGVGGIRSNAFEGFSNLISIIIPESVGSIGEEAFSGCTNITSVHISGIESWLDMGINSTPFDSGKAVAYIDGVPVTDLVIPSGITEIPRNAFRSWSSLVSVTIPDSVTRIGESAFANCTSLTAITIPNSIVQIENNAFENCTNVTRVNISSIESWLSVGFRNSQSSPFYYENAAPYLNGELVTELVLPSGFSHIGDLAFFRWTSLTSVIIQDGVESIGYQTFAGCSNLTSVIIPDSVTVIADAAFAGCSSLTSIDIQNVSVGFYTFAGCSSLTSITLPDMYWIPRGLFYGCSSLTTITIPIGTDVIDYEAFYGCGSLKEVYFLSDAPSMKSDCFYGVTANVFYPCDAMWTQDDMQNYGGSLLWEPSHTLRLCGQYDATCTTDAVRVYRCPCGSSEDVVTIPNTATGHSYDAVVTAPTCIEDGYTTYTCASCQSSYVDNSVSATGHSYENGICTVCGEKDPNYVVVPTLTLKYPTLAFEDEIMYNVYFTVDDLTAVVEMGLVTFADREPDGTVDTALELIFGYVANADGSYTAHTNGVPAKLLGDTMYFKVYAKLSDGTYVYTDVVGYHAAAYANTVLNSADSSDKAKALVVAMLNYGAAAQTYFNYKTDALMNASLTAEQMALVDAYDGSMVEDVVKADASKTGIFKMNGGYSNAYPTVSFEGAFSINYYFTPNKSVDDGLTFYYWDAKTYNSVDQLTVENATGVIDMAKSGSEYGAAVEGIAAKAIDETIYVAGFYISNGTSYPTNVIAYSLGNYCKTIAANGEAFGAATAVYGYYAKAYFN